MLLQQARDGIEVLGPARAAKRFPFALRLAGGLNGGVHVGLSGLGQAGQYFPRGRVPAVKAVAWGGELTVDEMTEAAALIDQPGQCLGGAFGCRAVFHGVENLFDGHVFSPQPMEWR